MPRAVLEIDANTAGILAAFGQIRTQAQETERVVRASMGNLFGGIPAGSRRAQQSAYRDTQQITRDQERAAQASVRAFVRAEEQKRRAAQLTAEGRARAERQASEIARTEAQRRGLTAEQEARVRTTALERVTRSVEREERAQTAAAQRESSRRERLGRDIAFGVRRGLNVGGDAAMNVARQAHSQIQDARRSRAEADRSLRFAVTGADRGAGEAEVSDARDQVRQFAVSAGMRYEDVVAALRQGQESGSVLERQGGETSAQAMARALRLVEEGRAFGTDPGGYLTAQGRLRAAGLQGENLTQAMRFSAVAANAGSVEIGQLMRQGLPGATRLMSQRVAALGPGATEEQRQQAMLGAFRESVATQEVTAAAGSTSRQVSNALASLQSFMVTPRRQQQALTNIQREVDATARTPEGERRRAALRALYEGDNAIFERDPTRQDPRARRLRQNVSPIELASRVAAAMGGDSQRAANIFAGGGHGNPQSFMENQRTLMAFLGGERGAAVRQMMGAAAYSEDDVGQRKAALRGDELANIVRSEEKGRNDVTDNTSQLKKLSDIIADFVASNPLGSSVIQTFGGLAAGLTGGALINRVGAAAARGTGPVASIARMLMPAAEGGAGAVTAGEAAAAAAPASRLLVRGNPVTAFLATLLTPSNYDQAAYDDSALIAAHRGAGGGGAGRTAAAMALNRPPSAQEIGNAVAESLRQAPLTAVVSPVDATHAATTAAPRR